MALVFQLFSEPPQNLLLDVQKVVMFDEPLVRFRLVHIVMYWTCSHQSCALDIVDKVSSAFSAHSGASLLDVPVVLLAVPDLLPDGGQLPASQTRGAWHVG